MYQEIWQKYKQFIPDFPSLRRPLIGAVIKETRVDKGIRQKDFAVKVGINESTLKSIENDHQQATTVENLTRCAEALNLSIEEIILSGRERDPANRFVFKKSPPSEVKGIRKLKRSPQEWHQSIRFPFKDFDVTPLAPPIATKKDLFICKINLPAKRQVHDLFLGVHHHVLGFISSGFNIKLVYKDTEEKKLTAGQGFSLDGFFPHSIVNDDEDTAAVIYLMTRLPNFGKARLGKPSTDKKKHSNPIVVGDGVDKIREYKSERPEQPLSIKHLAELTDSLDHEQVAKLARLKKGSSVIYWEKIEDLLSATGVAFEDFLKWSRKEEKNFVSISTASTRALIDYSTNHAVRIFSSVPPNINSEYFFGEIMLEGRPKIGRAKTWERKDNAMIAIYVEEGELEVAVGKYRSVLPLVKGESIYFDGNLGYVLRNPGEEQTKGIIATYPAIQF